MIKTLNYIEFSGLKQKKKIWTVFLKRFPIWTVPSSTQWTDKRTKRFGNVSVAAQCVSRCKNTPDAELFASNARYVTMRYDNSASTILNTNDKTAPKVNIRETPLSCGNMCRIVPVVFRNHIKIIFHFDGQLMWIISIIVCIRHLRSKKAQTACVLWSHCHGNAQIGFVANYPNFFPLFRDIYLTWTDQALTSIDFSFGF